MTEDTASNRGVAQHMWCCLHVKNATYAGSLQQTLQFNKLIQVIFTVPQTEWRFRLMYDQISKSYMQNLKITNRNYGRHTPIGVVLHMLWRLGHNTFPTNSDPPSCFIFERIRCIWQHALVLVTILFWFYDYKRSHYFYMQTNIQHPDLDMLQE